MAGRINMKTSIEYRDPLELSEELAKLGQFTKITQLEGGSGFYTMQATSANKIALAEISANKTLLYEGWGNGITIDFNWITPKLNTQGAFGYCDGFEMTNNSLAGFSTINPVPGNAWGKYTNECSSTGCMIKKQFLLELLENCKAYDGLERLTGDQGLYCNNKALNQLKRLAAREISSGIQNQQKYFDLVIACLEEPMSEQNSQEPKHIDHLREIINLAHNEKTMESPLSLLEVCKYINTSQASLYRICQEYFGMGIIELMTQIRLEESRRIMLNQEARQKLNLLSIRDIAIKYGFKHQGRYARRYYTAFGELPSQTIEKSRRYKLPI